MYNADWRITQKGTTYGSSHFQALANTIYLDLDITNVYATGHNELRGVANVLGLIQVDILSSGIVVSKLESFALARLFYVGLHSSDPGQRIRIVICCE